jgi:D-3-phosphoglycerate dehydrogenase
MKEPRSAPASSAGERAAPIVLLTDPIDSDATEPLSLVASVLHLGDPGFETITNAVRMADVVIVRRIIPAEALSDAHNLRALIRNGVGLDFIPVEVASQQGIAVVNTPGTNARSVAEAAVGMMLAGFRRISYKDRMIRQGHWASLRDGAFAESEISGKKLGLVGFGAIAQEIARIAHFGFDMQVTAATRSQRDGPPYVLQTALNEVLRKSDVIVIACPLTEVTRGIIGADEISAMKRGSAIVNIARGPIIQEAALAEALRAGHLRFAALDVLSKQPPSERDPILGLENVVLTPHTAGITKQAMQRMSALSVEEALRVLRSERPRNLVNAGSWRQIAERWSKMPVLRPG